MEPFDSTDLTEVIEKRSGQFVVLKSPDTAEDKPSYRIVMEFPTEAEAKAFLGTASE